MRCSAPHKGAWVEERKANIYVSKELVLQQAETCMMICVGQGSICAELRWNAFQAAKYQTRLLATLAQRCTAAAGWGSQLDGRRKLSAHKQLDNKLAFRTTLQHTCKHKHNANIQQQACHALQASRRPSLNNTHDAPPCKAAAWTP